MPSTGSWIGSSKPTVSNDEVERAAGASAELLPDEYVALERAVRQLLDDVAGFRARARVAEQRVAELERTVRDMSTGALDPLKMRESLRRMEAENRELRRRMVQAQDRVRRLVARFDFLREEM